MSKDSNTSLRDTLKLLEDEGEVARVEGEVDPIYQISGIQKALENGPALLFENIKGYPDVRDAGNIFARRERMARIFGLSDARELKFKCLDAIRKPLPPRTVSEAPCQEVVLTGDINVMATLPILKHTERDGARILGGGARKLCSPAILMSWQPCLF
jgi:4-hydroxy-3-polyprenylbenzoate decarboxylase